MRSERKKDAEHLDVEFREILAAIVRSRDGAGVKECVEWLKHGRVSGKHEPKRDASVTVCRLTRTFRDPGLYADFKAKLRLVCR
jgi:hypothetical protein